MSNNIAAMTAPKSGTEPRPTSARQHVAGRTCARKPRPQRHVGPLASDLNLSDPNPAPSASLGLDARLLPLPRLTDSGQLAKLFPFLPNPSKGLFIPAVCRIDGDSLSGCPTVPSASAWQALTRCANKVGCHVSTDKGAIAMDPTCVIRSCTDQWIAATSSICLPLSAPALRDAGVYLSRLPSMAAGNIDNGNVTASTLLAKHHAMVGATSNATLEEGAQGELGVCAPTLPVGTSCHSSPPPLVGPAVPAISDEIQLGQPLLPMAALLSPAASATQEALDPFPILLRSVPTQLGSTASHNLSAYLTADNFYSLVHCDPSTHTVQPTSPPYSLPSTFSLTPRPLIDARTLQRTDTPGTIDAPAPTSPDWVVQLVISIFLLVFLFGTYVLKLYGPRILQLWIHLQHKATGAHTTTQRELVLKPASNHMLDDVGELRSGQVRERMSQARPGEVVDFRDLGAGDVDEELGVVVLEGEDALPRYMAPSIRSSMGSVRSLGVGGGPVEGEMDHGDGPAPVYETVERVQVSIE